FDTGADRSFISTAFNSLIDIVPTPLGISYDVELADGKIVRIDTIMRGLHFKFLKPSVQHRFNACGTGQFRRYNRHGLVKKVSRRDRVKESRLIIISCLKVQKYMAKGCQIFLAQISANKEENKSKGKQLKDISIIRDFPEVFLEDFSGLPPARPV
nr:hypothetical protein [Tanacetum cinerariifolium]